MTGPGVRVLFPMVVGSQAPEKQIPLSQQGRMCPQSPSAYQLFFQLRDFLNRCRDDSYWVHRSPRAAGAARGAGARRVQDGFWRPTTGEMPLWGAAPGRLWRVRRTLSPGAAGRGSRLCTGPAAGQRPRARFSFSVCNPEGGGGGCGGPLRHPDQPHPSWLLPAPLGGSRPARWAGPVSQADTGLRACGCCAPSVRLPRALGPLPCTASPRLPQGRIEKTGGAAGPGVLPFAPSGRSDSTSKRSPTCEPPRPEGTEFSRGFSGGRKAPSKRVFQAYGGAAGGAQRAAAAQQTGRGCRVRRGRLGRWRQGLGAPRGRGA